MLYRILFAWVESYECFTCETEIYFIFDAILFEKKREKPGTKQIQKLGDDLKSARDKKNENGIKHVTVENSLEMAAAAIHSAGW